MEATEKDIKRISLAAFVILLGVLVFLILKPVFLSVIAGLILAYIFVPVYKWTLRLFRNKTLSASIVSVIALALILIPLWFFVPLMIKQVFDVFQFSQNLDVQNFVSKLFPSAADQALTQITLTINSTLSKFTSLILNSLVDILLDFPRILLHLAIAAFVFFFALRDKESLEKFVSGLSPLNKTQEAALVVQFKRITESVIYGQILIGLAQGILVGIGLLVFGVPNALLLAVLASILSIIPVAGPGFVYFPVTVYLFLTGDPFPAAVFLLFNLLIVSTIDNLLRTFIVSKRTNLSQVIVLVGMVGGLFVFGVLGLILGPLILGYFLTFLEAYKEKRLSSFFAQS